MYIYNEQDSEVELISSQSPPRSRSSLVTTYRYHLAWRQYPFFALSLLHLIATLRPNCVGVSQNSKDERYPIRPSSNVRI